MALPLTEGDEGPEIADLRSRLRRWLQSIGEETADAPEADRFDATTAQLVQRFQRERNLPADAVVGVETWKALVDASYRLGDRLLWHSRSLMRGDDVLDLQHRLNQLGFDAGLEDGFFGSDCRTAVMDFQADAGLEVDGIVGARTVEALLHLHRSHLAGGLGVQVREQAGFERMARHGLTGLGILIDPATVTLPPGATALTDPNTLTWQMATRIAARLAGLGSAAVLSRGPQSAPSSVARARLANRLDVDIVLSVSLNALATSDAGGCASYYYGSLRFTSDTGRRLAGHMLDAALSAGLGPDCRSHPMTWSLLRETRMPAVILEPGFVTNPDDVALLSSPRAQDRLADRVVSALDALLHQRPS